jgi:hypothetical protein
MTEVNGNPAVEPESMTLEQKQEARRKLDEQIREQQEAEEQERATEPYVEPRTEAPPFESWPANVPHPENGIRIGTLYFKSSTTMKPTKGDRYCVCVPLSASEEIAADKRAEAHGTDRAFEIEHAKGCIRIIDGEKATWTKTGNGDVDRFWNEIGSKNRKMIIAWWRMEHRYLGREQLDFLKNSLFIRTVLAE